MGRRPHLLTRQELPSLPGRIISLDCHPYITPDIAAGWHQRHSLLVGCLVSTDYEKGYQVRRDVEVFTTHDQAWRIVSGHMLRRRQTWLVAHNLAYDATLAGLWRWVEEGRLRVEHYVIDDPPSIIRLTDGERRLVCVDLLNYWRKPLSDIAESVGVILPPLGTAGCDRNRAEHVARIHALATADAADRMVSFLRSTLGGGWGTTAAAVSWSAFRSRCWGDRIRVHNHKEATRLERASYAGGRVLCHRIGKVKGPIYVLDINNLYGSVMHRERYPIRFRAVERWTPSRLAVALDDGLSAVAGCRVAGATADYPLRTDAGFVYPVGTFDTVLAGPDLKQALSSGRVDRIYDAATYDSGRPFVPFVEHWYGARLCAREHGDRAGAALAKLITSCVFGRLAMKGRRWKPYKGPPPRYRYYTWHEPSEHGEGWDVCRAVAGVPQRYVTEGEGPHSMVACAAYVTAYARQEMRRLRLLAGIDEVYYEDTDSLHCSQAGYDRLVSAGEVHPTRLGALKVVGVHPSATYCGQKSYVIGDKVVQAGLTADARQVSDGLWVQEKKRGLCRLPSDGPATEVLVESQQFRRGH